MSDKAEAVPLRELPPLRRIVATVSFVGMSAVPLGTVAVEIWLAAHQH